MNKLGVHALVWEKGWSHAECERAIANTAAVGFDLIEVPALDPSLIDTAHTRRQPAQSGQPKTQPIGSPGRVGGFWEDEFAGTHSGLED